MADAFLHRRSVFDKRKDAYGLKNPIKQRRVARSWDNPITRRKREKSLHTWANSFAGKRHYRKLSRHNALHLHEDNFMRSESTELKGPKANGSSDGTFVQIKSQSDYDRFIKAGLAGDILADGGYEFDDIKDCWWEINPDDQIEVPTRRSKGAKYLDGLGEDAKFIYVTGGRLYTTEGIRRYIEDDLGVDLEDYGLEPEEWESEKREDNSMGPMSLHETLCAARLKKLGEAYNPSEELWQKRLYDCLKREVDKVDLDYDAEMHTDGNGNKCVAIVGKGDDSGTDYLSGYIVRTDDGAVLKYDYFENPDQEMPLRYNSIGMAEVAHELFKRVEPLVGKYEDSAAPKTYVLAYKTADDTYYCKNKYGDWTTHIEDAWEGSDPESFDGEMKRNFADVVDAPESDLEVVEIEKFEDKSKSEDSDEGQLFKAAVQAAWSASGAKDFKLDITRDHDIVKVYAKGVNGEDNVGIWWHITIPDSGETPVIKQYASWGDSDSHDPERTWAVKDLDELEKSFTDEFEALQETIDVGKEN